MIHRCQRDVWHSLHGSGPSAAVPLAAVSNVRTMLVVVEEVVVLLLGAAVRGMRAVVVAEPAEIAACCSDLLAKRSGITSCGEWRRSIWICLRMTASWIRRAAPSGPARMLRREDWSEQVIRSEKKRCHLCRIAASRTSSPNSSRASGKRSSKLKRSWREREKRSQRMRA